jgi:glycosyltransferase involved in cell wall biosynthesis
MGNQEHWQQLHRQVVTLEPGLGSFDLLGLLQQPCPSVTNERSWLMQQVLERVLQPPRRLLLIHGFVVGGVERVAAHAAQAVASRLGGHDLLVLATDQLGLDTLDWFSGTGTLLSLPHLEREPLAWEERALVLAQLIRFWRPQAVLNLHSAAGWRALERFGAALTQPTRWSAGLFCRDRLPNGLPVSHADRYLRSTLPLLERLFCDHQAFLSQLSSDFALTHHSRARLQVLYQPVEFPEIPRESCSLHGERVLWTGRLCQQKRPDLLVQVAASMPHVQFDLYGPAVPADQWQAWGFDRAPNVQACGSYTCLADLPLARYGALLFTSDYEGLPNVLLEAGAFGVPMVAMGVGGVPELINQTTGWLVPPEAGPEGLVLALEHCRADRAEAERRALACRALLRRRHSPRRYWQTASSTSQFFRSAS